MGGQCQPLPLYPQGRPGTAAIGGRVGPWAGLDGCAKCRFPDRPVLNESLYRLNYPGTVMNRVLSESTSIEKIRSVICGNKMPTRCNRGFYCRSYCLLNMFRAPLCPSSVAQECYTVVAACGISCCGFQVAGLVWS